VVRGRNRPILPTRPGHQKCARPLQPAFSHFSGNIYPIDLTGNRGLIPSGSRDTGTEVKLDNEELLIMKESDIMGIIEGQPAAKRKAA
jgi:chaperonin GroES